MSLNGTYHTQVKLSNVQMTEPKQRSLDGKEHPSDVMPCKQKATRALDTLIAHSRIGLIFKGVFRLLFLPDELRLYSQGGY